MSQLIQDPRKLIKALRAQTDAVMGFLAWMDLEMVKPSTHERGQRIARACSGLDMLNDRTRYFALGVDYRRDNKPKEYARCLKKATGGATDA